jgi:dCTP diphosphatase
MGDRVSPLGHDGIPELTGMTVNELVVLQREFVRERNWVRFHSPRNLSVALAVEVAELLEHFQWNSNEDCGSISPEETRELTGEIADVFLFLLSLVDALGIDLVAATLEKLEINGQRWPPGDSQGRWIPRNRDK